MKFAIIFLTFSILIWCLIRVKEIYWSSGTICIRTTEKAYVMEQKFRDSKGIRQKERYFGISKTEDKWGIELIRGHGRNMRSFEWDVLIEDNKLIIKRKTTFQVVLNSVLVIGIIIGIIPIVIEFLGKNIVNIMQGSAINGAEFFLLFWFVLIEIFCVWFLCHDSNKNVEKEMKSFLREMFGNVISNLDE